MSVEELKKAGNAALQAGDFAEAIAKYTEALRLDPTNHVLLSNRSAAYCSSGQYKNAEDDGRKCVQSRPDFVKGYGRIGAALIGLGDIDGAMEAYSAGLEIDSTNEALRQGMLDCERAKASGAGAGEGGLPAGGLAAAFGPQLLAKMAASPQHAHLLADAEFMGKLRAVQANPQLLQQYISDSRFLDVLSLALGAQVQVRRPGDEHDPAPQASRPTRAPSPKKPAGPVLTDDQKEALALKDKGNEAYKARNFAEAISFYEQASEKDPESFVPALNTLSVLIEMGDFTAAIEKADALIEKIQATRPVPYEQLAKAMTRKGTAIERTGDLQGAIAAYKAAMLEHRNQDTLKKLRAAEALFQKKTEEAYYDKDKAAEARKEANAAFRAGDLKKAVDLYTEAIKRDPLDPANFTNRAAAYLKLGSLKLITFDDAIKDCDDALKLDPNFIRAITRKAKAYLLRGDYLRAMEWYDRALKIEPDNADARAGRDETIQAINDSQSTGTAEEQQERLAKARSDPEVQAILMDPMMRIVIDTLSTNPEKGADYLRDKDIAAKLNKLIAAGVIQTR